MANAYDRILADPAERPAINLRPEDVEFEIKVVLNLLTFFELSKTLTPKYLLEQEQHRLLNRDDKPTLTLRAFHDFFPAFPFLLSAGLLVEAQTEHLTFPKAFQRLSSTALYRKFREHLDAHRATAQRGDQRDFGGVLRWPHVKTRQSLVLHTRLRINANVPGPHVLWTDADGTKIVVEPLETLLEAIDRDDPKQDWMLSAAYTDFGTLVS